MLLQVRRLRIIWRLSMLHAITSDQDVARADLWLGIGIKQSLQELLASNGGFREHEAEFDSEYLNILPHRRTMIGLDG